MHDRRAVTSLVLGLAGAGTGVAAIGASSPPLGLIAGLCALGAGGLAWLSAEAANGAPADDAAEGARRELAAARERESALQARLADAEQELTEARRSSVAAANGQLVGGRPIAAGGAGAGHGDTGGDGERDGDALVDPVTGLYSENYLMVALDARIAAARRRLRPVSVVMVEVVQGIGRGEPQPSDPVVVSAAVRATLREADTASRLTDGRYALVLEDTPENGAIWTIERLRSFLVSEHPDYTVWAGVACYPAHAFNLDEIVEQATAALDAAREWRQDRIEVATAD